MTYRRQDCVIVVTGRAWAEDNSRQRGQPEDVGANAVAYVDTRRPTRSLVFVIGKRRLYWVDNADIQSLDPVSTGDAFANKVCLTCGLLKPTEDFEFNQVPQGDAAFAGRAAVPALLGIAAAKCLLKYATRTWLNMVRSKATYGNVHCARSTA